ncbi:MAG: hypothetical protein IT521_08465 [Burkholderiales bacterium]|nr:hypothetical protein [Burkholderiales bacterium]
MLREAHLVLEIIDPPYVDPDAVTFPELLADGVVNQGLFVGSVIAEAFSRPLEMLPFTVRTAAGVLFATRDGKHPDFHPFHPLYWLANYLTELGDPLRAGVLSLWRRDAHHRLHHRPPDRARHSRSTRRGHGTTPHRAHPQPAMVGGHRRRARSLHRCAAPARLRVRPARYLGRNRHPRRRRREIRCCTAPR